MTPDRWTLVESLYHAARTHPAHERAAFLADGCAGDDALREEVESLLEQGASAEGFLERGAAAAAAQMMSDTGAATPAGRRIGIYQVQTLLGAGGMGEVYRARDTKLGREVAIKILPRAFMADPERLARFEREARMLASLNHPNIGSIYGLEEVDGVCALVLELVEGETLADKLAHVSTRTSRVPGLPIAEALTIARQIADALDAAHKKGIIHRDLKPANIKVTPDGVVKVLDFGLAKAVAGGSTPDFTQSPTMTVGGTRDGMILGTAAYMSPEQARGQAVDKRTDIWAFGCVLYEILTGHATFARETTTDTLAAIIERDPEWDALPPATPPAIDRLLRRCLEKDPGRRLHDVADVRIEIDEADSSRSTVPAHVGSKPARTSTRFRWVTATGTTLLVIGLAAGGWWVFPTKAHALTEKDTIVLADFTNTTGDPVFDGALRQGLSVQLEQSPFLSLVSDERIHKALSLMGRPSDARLTPDLAGEICERTGSSAVLDGSIASLGSQYVLGLRAKNCRTGDILDEEQVQAGRKEDVLNALSQIASTFRTRVGESLTTVEQHNTPLEEATTPSLEALKAYSAGSKILFSGNDLAAAVPLFKRAIEIDPRFAMAHASLGFTYGLIGEPALSAESNSKAYQLRDRASDRERFFITATYDLQVTGNLEKALLTCELWVQTYPREKDPYGLLGAFLYPTFGKYEKGVGAARQEIELDPDFPIGYLQLAFNNQFLGRLEEAENAIQRASDRKVDVPDFFPTRYDVAFLRGDKIGMDREVTLAQGKPGAEDAVSQRQGFVLAYSGRLQQARRMSRRAADLAQQAAQPGRAALFETGAALWEAFFANASAARQGAVAALELSKDRDVEYGAALALALAGNSSESQTIANDLEKRFPEDTEVRFTYLPAIRGLLALNHHEPVRAIEQLQVATPYDLGTPLCSAPGFFGIFYTIYVRGLAYLAARQGVEAAAEFQKILDHRGIVVSDPIGALAHLQLGRAFALSGDKTRAQAAYQDFLTLWKDADTDIPVLVQAKSEYARLAETATAKR